MTSIKFSHRYLKQLRGNGKIGYVSHADLLFVVKVKLENLPPSFIDYDTTYFVGENDQSFANYPLPKKGDYIVLFLLAKEDGFIFTTIRRWTPQKEKYYEGLRGKTLTMEYVDEVAK